MLTTPSRFAALLTVSMIAAHSHAGAQCNGLSIGTKYKVLIDEVQYSAPAGVKPAVSLDMLQSSVEGALEKLRQSLLNVATVLKGTPAMGDIEYLTCTGRHTRDTEFDDSFMRSMVGNHAILEFWGTLFALDGGQHKFDIRYVMFPVSSAAQPRPSEFAMTQKTVASKPTPEQITDFFVNTRSDLPAYFTASVGLQKDADRQLSQAVRSLC